MMYASQYPAEVFGKKANSLLDASMDEVITKGLFRMLEIGHPPTAVHSIGVARLAAGLATETDLKDSLDNPIEFVRDAILHDIGKLRVSTSILDKPGRLSDDQFNVIRKHPTVGFMIVRSFDEGREPVVNRAARILLSHYTQRHPYSSRADITSHLKRFNENDAIIYSKEFMLTSIALNITDHFDARFPCNSTNAISHGYNDRDYPVSALPLMVEASFAESKRCVSWAW